MTIERKCGSCKHHSINNEDGSMCKLACFGDHDLWELFTPILPNARKFTSIYIIRDLGRDYCQTEGSTHYKKSSIEPIEYAIANNKFEDFAVTSIVKYITRFGETRNKNDLKKVADFAHLLCGVEIDKDDTR